MIAGTTHHVTRRTFQGKCLLRPDGFLKETWDYLLGLLSVRYSIEVHSYVVLSNHYHMVLTDYGGNLSHFMRDLNSMLAAVINLERGRKGPVWEHEKFHQLELHGPETVRTRLVYGMTNPVKHGLVGRPEAWPGAISLPGELGKRRIVPRPDLGYFSHGTLPLAVELELTIPPALGFQTLEAYREGLEERVQERVATLNRERRGPYLGKKRVLRSRVEDPIPRRWDRDRESTKRRYPIAGDTPEQERELLEGLRRWHEAYAFARERWPKDKTVVFPNGTFDLREFHGARIEPM